MTALNVDIVSAPAVLRERIESVPVATLETFREVFTATLRDKIATLKKGDADIVERVMNDAIARKHDKALKVMIVSGIPANHYARKMRQGDHTFNAKAIPKGVFIPTQLLSATPLWDGSMPQTIRGTIEGLLRGAQTAPKGLTGYLDEYMSARGFGRTPGHYTAGNTQSSSSAHALASLGLINVDHAGKYDVADWQRELLASMIGNN